MPKAKKQGNYSRESIPEKKPIQPTKAEVKDAQKGFSKDSPAQKKFNAAQLGGYAANKKK